tara:strand:- start:1004 stop:2041 length:1038 start_codon:yes stop_codon:yes gene_type:complete
MDKETHKKLIKDFPKSVVKPAPKGKFGHYVPHHIYTQRLVDVVPGKYNFFIKETIRNKDNAVEGAICRLEIEGLGVVEEIGDVDTHAISRNITESEVLKLAVSDGIKRCCMRFGIGLELWTGGTTEEEHYAGDNPKPPKPTKPQGETNKNLDASSKETNESLDASPKKKQVTQENGKSHSEISEVELKKLVFEMCDKDKKFAEACWKNSHSRTKLKDKTLTDNVGEWEKYTVEMFLEFADNYVKKFKKDFEIRAGNSDSINEVLETFDTKIVEEKENEVADIPEGKWMDDSISEAQRGFIESLITKAIDSGQDELGAEAKSYLNSGEATKGNASEWIEKLQKATE